MVADFPARLARPSHPGSVTFVGTDGVQRVELAEHVPDWLKFAPGPDGSPVAVVKVVRLLSDRGYSLRSYAADGDLLWVGLTVPTGPARPAAVAAPVATPRPTMWDRAPEPTGWF